MLVHRPPVLQADKGKGRSPAERTEELERARILLLRSSSLLEASEQAAHALNDTSGCSHGPPVPDITERYSGSQLPTVGGERAGVDQEPSFAGAVVVRETCHGSTSAKPWHGL